MTVTFDPTQDNRRIAENQYATNPDVIGFTKFTSCIGIVAILNNNDLFGLHIVMIKDAIFGEDPNDVQEVLNKIGDRKQVIIVGLDDLWENPDNGVSKAYAELKEKLGNPKVYQVDQEAKSKDARGVFHAKKVGDDIKVMLCIESEPESKAGQTSRSSDNFSSQEDEVVGAKDTPIRFTLPDGISVKVADDNRNAPDPAVFTDVKNGREEKNPYINELYVADPINANENFFVCVEKV